jgi:hypothetical protein
MNICCPPPTRVCVTNALTREANTSRQPASSPGIDSGSVTWKNVRQRPAPSASEAWRSAGSMFISAVISGSTISGSSICASATVTAPGVYSSLQRHLDPAPGHEQAVLMMPCRPRMTTQAKVRTTALVSSGSTISSISSAASAAAPACRSRRADSRSRA